MPPALPKWLQFLGALLGLVRRIMDMIDDDPGIPFTSRDPNNTAQLNALNRVDRTIMSEETEQ